MLVKVGVADDALHCDCGNNRKTTNNHRSDPGAQARKAAADQELRAHYEDLLLFKPNQSVKDTMMNIRRSGLSTINCARAFLASPTPDTHILW